MVKEVETRHIVGSENINGLTKKVIAAIPEFFERIAEHDEDNPVPSIRIEKKLGISGKDVRSIVNLFRASGCPIASGHSGYFMAKNHTELVATKKNLDSLVNGIVRARAGIDYPVFEGWTIERLYNS